MSRESEREAWLAHLGNDRRIEIVPFDNEAESKFQILKKKIQDALGAHVRVEHRGSTALGISGQDEIDVYVPVPPEQFDEMIPKLSDLFGEPRSSYPMQRVRYRADVDGKRIDLFLVNEEHDDWKEGVMFEAYLRTHPEALEEYRLLKQGMQGLGTQDYYRRKDAFIRDILSRE